MSSNLRKAAVLIRSLDAESAAGLLAHLSPNDAASVREAIRTLGPIDPDEQADLLAEFRRAKSVAAEPAHRGVELSISQPAAAERPPMKVEAQAAKVRQRRFDFLDDAPPGVLVNHLSREQPQTIAVVLSHLAPAQAAAVLAALPEKLQAQTIERLSTLGETDSESIAALESELAAWIARRRGGRAERGRRGDTMAAILAAADEKARKTILARLQKGNSSSITNRVATAGEPPRRSRWDEPTGSPSAQTQRPLEPPAPCPLPPAPCPLPRVAFDHLIHLDDRTLASVLREVDANALALALAGSDDVLVDRICDQMPKRMAKTFRRELRRLGPTRLSDVEAAQRLVAHHAALQLAQRRPRPVANTY